MLTKVKYSLCVIVFKNLLNRSSLIRKRSNIYQFQFALFCYKYIFCSHIADTHSSFLKLFCSPKKYVKDMKKLGFSVHLFGVFAIEYLRLQSKINIFVSHLNDAVITSYSASAPQHPLQFKLWFLIFLYSKSSGTKIFSLFIAWTRSYFSFHSSKAYLSMISRVTTITSLLKLFFFTTSPKKKWFTFLVGFEFFPPIYDFIINVW